VDVLSGPAGRIALTITAPTHGNVILQGTIGTTNANDPALYSAAGVRIAYQNHQTYNFSYTIPAGQTMTVFAGTGGDVARSYNITSTWPTAPSPFLSVDRTSWVAPPSGGVSMFTVSTNVSGWGVNIPLTSQNWLSSSVTGTTITLTAQENTQPSASRFADVAISGPGVHTVTVRVTQAPQLPVSLYTDSQFHNQSNLAAIAQTARSPFRLQFGIYMRIVAQVPFAYLDRLKQNFGNCSHDPFCGTLGYNMYYDQNLLSELMARTGLSHIGLHTMFFDGTLANPCSPDGALGLMAPAPNNNHTLVTTMQLPMSGRQWIPLRILQHEWTHSYAVFHCPDYECIMNRGYIYSNISFSMNNVWCYLCANTVRSRSTSWL